MTTDLILGTAGHIDHGKTSLIRALTGVDTDRLPEEKKRGITIELGFAELRLDDFRLGIVDVPGHERFVRNMLAGATGMDLAMLVVAADDSVKPQTREHLEILRLLDRRCGVVALTKCDLVEPEWLDLVEEEVRELVADTFLDGAPVVRTSAATGEGLDTLRQCLKAAAERVVATNAPSIEGSPFRMAIDRTFSVAGHGTVVTGSVASGRVAVGDELLIQPGDIAVRVRGLQNHDRVADEVHRGQRAAINLAGVHHDQTRRGQELTTPGYLIPSRLITAQLSLLDSAPRSLKSRTRVRVHVGTAELLASVRLLGCDQLKPGETAAAQLFLNEFAVVTWRQPLVIRSESPVITVGGGVVLVPCAERIRKSDDQALGMIHDLLDPSDTRRASAALFFAGSHSWQPQELARTAGIEDTAKVHQQLIDEGLLMEIVVSPKRTIRIHRLLFEQLCKRVEAAMRRLHQDHPLRTAFDRSQLISRFAYLGDDALVQAILHHLGQAGRIKLSQREVALVGQGPKLSQSEERLLHQLVADFHDAGLKPPTVKECQQQATKNRDSVPQLLAIAASNGDLVKIGDDLYLHTETEQAIRQQLAEELRGSNGMTLSQIREALSTTRKYAVPLCEYLDETGFTERQGDLRVLANREPA